MPLDETIDAGQTGHIADHEAIAETLNDLDSTYVALGASAIGELSTDYSNSTTGSYDDITSVTFTPKGTKVRVHVSGSWSAGVGANCFFRVNQSGTVKYLGAPVPHGTGPQLTIAGDVIYTGLTPGTPYVFSIDVKPTSGTFECRVATFPEYEQMRILACDA